jgi:putative ABC transport system permease protein
VFVRMLCRQAQAGRARLGLALATVASGATVLAALLNLQVGIESKLARSFRSLGANAVLVSSAGQQGGLLEAGVLTRLGGHAEVTASVPYLYVVAEAERGRQTVPVVLAGTELDAARRTSPWWRLSGYWPSGARQAVAGSRVATVLGLQPGQAVRLQYGGRSLQLTIVGVITSGSAEDSQILAPLDAVQNLTGLVGRLSVVQIRLEGTPHQVESAAAALARELPPGVELRAVPELTQGEAALARRIRLLVAATLVLIVTLTTLGVLAALAALAADRRVQVGVMKALGGSQRLIFRLFLTEVILLTLAGVGAGWLAGLPLSQWMSRSVFGVPAGWHWTALAATAAAMLLASLLGALPLRRVGGQSPAEILRSERCSL